MLLRACWTALAEPCEGHTPHGSIECDHLQCVLAARSHCNTRDIVAAWPAYCPSTPVCRQDHHNLILNYRCKRTLLWLDPHEAQFTETPENSRQTDGETRSGKLGYDGSQDERTDLNSRELVDLEVLEFVLEFIDDWSGISFGGSVGMEVLIHHHEIRNLISFFQNLSWLLLSLTHTHTNSATIDL